MDIQEIFLKILKEEVAANSISGGGIDAYDPILKAASKLKKLRNKYNPTMTPKNKDNKSGPVELPHNAVSNSLDNGNKGPEQNPLDNFRKNDPVTNARKLAKVPILSRIK